MKLVFPEYRDIRMAISSLASTEKLTNFEHVERFTQFMESENIPKPVAFSAEHVGVAKNRYECRIEWEISKSCIVACTEVGGGARSALYRYSAHYGKPTDMNVYETGKIDLDTSDSKELGKIRSLVDEIERNASKPAVVSIVPNHVLDKFLSALDSWQVLGKCSYGALINSRIMLKTVNERWSLDELESGSSSIKLDIRRLGTWEDPNGGLKFEWTNSLTDAYLYIQVNNAGKHYYKTSSTSDKKNRIQDSGALAVILSMLEKVYKMPPKVDIS